MPRPVAVSCGIPSNEKIGLAHSARWNLQTGSPSICFGANHYISSIFCEFSIDLIMDVKRSSVVDDSGCADEFKNK